MSKRVRCNEGVAESDANTGLFVSDDVSNAKKQRTGTRNQKLIAKNWWTERRNQTQSLLQENERLQLLLHQANQAKCTAEQQCSQMMDELVTTRGQLLESKRLPPFIKKVSDRRTMLQVIADAILFLLSIVMFRTKGLTRLYALKEVIFDNKLFGKLETHKVLGEMTTKYARENIFLPWKVLRSIDLAINGGINYTGIEALRKVEELQKYQRGCLPCRSSIQKCAAELHEIGQTLIPFYKVDSELGEMYQFHYEMMLRHLLKSFKLLEVAQRETVEICITLDGAELTKDLCHLSFGLKITDPRAIDPRDGTPLVCSQEGIMGSIFKVQSRNYCFILKSLLGKDSKAAYKEFTDVFKFFESVMKAGLPANQYGPRIMPMLVWSPQDLSSIWKSLNTGGGARKAGSKHWCHLCACNGDKIASYVLGDNRCQSCIQNSKEKCYHWPVGTEDSIIQFQQELTHQMAEYELLSGITLLEVKAKSEIIYNPAEINKYRNKYNIDFDPTMEDTDELDILFFSALVNKELRLRGLPFSGNATERQARLRQHLMIEERIDRIKEAIKRTEEGKDAALILIKQTVPCIMHLENRVGEKIITVLLSIGAASFQRDRGSTTLDLYVDRIQNIVQQKILGTNIRPKQWRFPLKENGKEVAKVSLSNKKTRRFIMRLHGVINAVFVKAVDEARRDCWMEMIEDYCIAMEILRKRSDYTDEDIEIFQDKMDSFFKKYLQETGVEGITNYIHMLGSGHIKYYMLLHRNLYKYSQQGWESLNSKFKQVFFRHTQRGGNYGADVEENERYYLCAVLKAFQRECLWISGEAEIYFTQKNR